MQQLSRLELVLSEINAVKSSLSSKKKYGPMKEALINFQQVMDRNKDNAFQISRSDIQKLLLPAQQSLRSAKFHITLISFILKLINLRVLTDINTSEDVLTYFLKVKEIQKDALQLKLIQSFMTLIHPEFIQFGNFAFVEKCLTMVLFMKCSKNPIINSSAETTLYRVIELLSASTQLIIANKGTSFDNMEIQLDLEDTSEAGKSAPTVVKTDNQQVNNLASILHDLTLIADYQRPVWYPANVPLDREFGLISINSFLTNMGKFFLEYKQIENVLKLELLNTLKKIVLTPSSMIKMSIIIQGYKSIIILCDIGPLIFTELWSLLTYQIQGEHSVLRNLAYQSLVYLVQSQLLLETMLKQPMDEKNFILDLITIVSGQAKECLGDGVCELVNPTCNVAGEQNEVQVSDDALICRMISEFQNRFISSVCVYAEQHQVILGQPIKSDQINIIMEHTWKLNLRTLKHLLSKNIDEQTLQNVLSAIQTHILIVGSLQMRTPQNAFIKTLCQFAKPTNDFLFSHIQINKMVLNIANCLGNLLECSSWLLILRTFQENENDYLRNRLAKNGSQEEQNKTLDISIIFLSLDQLFAQSATYENEHLLSIMDAINQLTIEMLETGVKSDLSKQKVFSLSKLIELIKNNLFRLDIFWELIMAHFISVISSRNSWLSQMAAEALSSIVFMGFEHMKQHFKKPVGFIKDKWSLEEHQFTLLSPWLDLCAIRGTEVREVILSNVLRMLQNNGFEVQGKGWDAIVLILVQISNEQTSIYVKQGLACTETIINQFLPALTQSQISKLFDIIDNFKANSHEQNVSFQICNMLWHLGDFLTKSQVQFLPRIFYKLSIFAQDPIPEIRHSALHIFTNLLLHFQADATLLLQEWKQALEGIFLPMLQKIVHTFQDKNSAKEQDGTHWEETTKSAIQNAIKLAKKYFLLVEEQSANDMNNVVSAILTELVISLQQNRPGLSLEVARAIRELFHFQPILCLQNMGPMFDQLSVTFNSPPQDLKYLKSLILHISIEILELIAEVIKLCTTFHTKKIYELYFKILEFPLVAHMIVDLIQNKIFFEDGIAPKGVMNALEQVISKSSDETLEVLQSCILRIVDSPTNKYRYLLIKRLLNQLNGVMLHNSLFTQFSDTYVTLIKRVGNDPQFGYFQVQFEDKSILVELVETLFQIGDRLQSDDLLRIYQSLLWSSDEWQKQITNQALKPLLQERRNLQKLQLQKIQNLYETTEIINSQQFLIFVEWLYELSLDEQDFSIDPLKLLITLCDKSEIRTKICLSYVLEASMQLLNSSRNDIVIILLQSLNSVVIPSNSFMEIEVNNEVQRFAENHIYQKQDGHLLYLLGYISKQINNQDVLVRKEVQLIMEHISNVLSQ